MGADTPKKQNETPMPSPAGDPDKRDGEQAPTPARLGDYITVANPGTWMVLLAILLFLIGLFTWCAFARITTRVSTVVVSNGDGIHCYVKAEDIDDIAPGQTLLVNDSLLTVDDIGNEPVEVNDAQSDYVRKMGNLTRGEYVYPVTLEGELTKGIYDAEIIVESVAPLKLILH